MTHVNQPRELSWGDLILDSEVPADLPWKCETMAEGSSLGNPVPVVEEVESMLDDGDLSIIASYGNREITFRVRLSAHDGDALAQAEAALAAAAYKRNPDALRYTPPLMNARPCEFIVVTAKVDGDYSDGWDFDEAYQHCRYYVITWTCLPWAQDPEPMIIPALPKPENPAEPPVVFNIDTCDSTTGWVGAASPTTGWTGLTGVTASSGAVRISGTRSGLGWLSLERTGAVSMTDTPYLQVVAVVPNDGISYPIQPDVSVQFDNGQPITPVAMQSNPLVAHHWTMWFPAPASFNKVKVRSRTQPPTATLRYLYVHNLARTDQPSNGVGGGFQVARTATVGGTARTQAAAIRFTSDDGPLISSTGFIYTGLSAGIALRPYLTSSALPVSVDPETVSGSRNTLADPSVFLIPVKEFTRATYSLFPRLRTVTEPTVSWSARVVDAAGDDIPGSDIVESGSTLCADADGWMIQEIGAIPMPVLAIEGDSTHCVELTISVTSGGEAVQLDDAWLLDTDNGAVSVFHQPTEFDLTGLELRSPRVGNPRQAVIATWDGYGAQDIITRGNLVTRVGTHIIEPGVLQVLTVTDGARYAGCEIWVYLAYHTHPGSEVASGPAAGAVA